MTNHQPPALPAEPVGLPKVLTVREAIFLANSRALYSVDRYTLDEVRRVVAKLAASRSRDLNFDTACTEANRALDFRLSL